MISGSNSREIGNTVAQNRAVILTPGHVELGRDHNAIREIASQHGAAMNAWQNADPQACRAFRDAEGDIEFTSDGASVNRMAGLCSVMCSNKWNDYWNTLAT